MSVRFFVPTKPVTQGSVTAYPIKRKNGSYGATVTHDHSDKLHYVRYAIGEEYRKTGGKMYEGAVAIDIHFEFLRPKSVSEKKRPDMTVKPDLDKLCRTVLDALTGVAYRDDSQVVTVVMGKYYSDEEGITVLIGGVRED